MTNPLTKRRPFPFRFPLDTLVTWPPGPTGQSYRLDQRRWVESHTGTWAEYALVAFPHGRSIVCWVTEADLTKDERVR